MKKITKQRIVIIASVFLLIVLFAFWGDEIIQSPLLVRFVIFTAYALIVAGAVKLVGGKSQ